MRRLTALRLLALLLLAVLPFHAWAAAVAAVAAGAFLALGCGLIFLTGQESFILGWLAGPTAAARLLRNVLPIIALALLLQGFFINRAADAVGINKALLSAALTLVIMGLTAVLTIRAAKCTCCAR